MAADPADSGSAGRGKCPICGQPSASGYRPFCSRRCADVDLSRWLSDVYVIADEADSEDGGTAPDDTDGRT